MAKQNEVADREMVEELVVDRPTLAHALALRNDKSVHDYGDRLVQVGRGKYKFVETVRNVVRSLRATATNRAGGLEGSEALAKANAQLKAANVELTQLKVARMRGDLISLDEVKTAWDEVALQVKQLFLAYPSRARFDLPHLSGADQKILERLARDMLSELSFTKDEPPLPTGAREHKRGRKPKNGRDQHVDE